ncbi:hypothetical protein BD309DRAFT_859313 [Dichomitus squalens]|uniref:ABM domain-containing protein n=1 Tax=Dichomitus squalens TaxID=114155 RepID=A0A4Q9MPU7_9APHY|nr:uncharacterized protein DICSQDRAFT_135595 [Dichomitus squalens LYAD-421 SS1]EJF62632.1 hypothetical protein DICSQDRAFT_135595 [Dichomitus squalens LYAD-421 SS1]TBU28998.1 hypothetical protein BD311DRAFT_806435 [Dichomitus squalens]TBU45859.1 hypothetical protein BD309DRAFT_859313 [Dichomitus squalens]TBU60627.1 hypothetical protein BD310DRAFT_947138 [Dichomitus squalens]
MAFPTVEFIAAPATEAFRASPHNVSTVKPTVDILKSAEGMIRVYYGLEDEDKSSAYVCVAWETLIHHHNLMKDTEKYPKLSEDINSILDVSGIRMFHVAFTSEPYGALEAPVTEVATFTLHEGQSKDALEGLVDDLATAMNAAPKSAGVILAAWGPTVEKDDLIALVIGWTSIDAHWALVATDQPIKDLIEQIRGIATITVKHVALAHH